MFNYTLNKNLIENQPQTLSNGNASSPRPALQRRLADLFDSLSDAQEQGTTNAPVSHLNLASEPTAFNSDPATADMALSEAPASATSLTAAVAIPLLQATTSPLGKRPAEGQQWPQSEKRVALAAEVYQGLTIKPSSQYKPSPQQELSALRNAPIVHNCLVLGTETYPLEQIGQGEEHNVWGFSQNGTITIPTTRGSIVLNQQSVVLKVLRPDKKAGRQKVLAHKADELSFSCLAGKFALFGQVAPVAQRLITAQEWKDVRHPKNGIDIWEKCELIDKEDAEVMNAFWGFGKRVCHLAVRYALQLDESGKARHEELVGDFRPPNVMLKAGTRSEFVIVDAKPSENDRWDTHLSFYISEWCAFCGKTFADMTENWSEQERYALRPKLLT